MNLKRCLNFAPLILALILTGRAMERSDIHLAWQAAAAADNAMTVAASECRATAPMVAHVTAMMTNRWSNGATRVADAFSSCLHREISEIYGRRLDELDASGRLRLTRAVQAAGTGYAVTLLPGSTSFGLAAPRG